MRCRTADGLAVALLAVRVRSTRCPRDTCTDDTRPHRARVAAGGTRQGLICGGRRCAPTPLRCSARGRAAELAAFAALTTLKQLRRVRSRSALARADPGPALLVATEIAPTGYRLPRSPPGGRRAGRVRAPPLFPQRRVRAGRGAPLRRREAQGLWPRAQRASCSDSSQLSERSERSERSEFCDGPRDRASQGSRRESAGRRSRSARPARTRLCRALHCHETTARPTSSQPRFLRSRNISHEIASVIDSSTTASDAP